MSEAQTAPVKTVNVQVESGSTEHALLTGAKKTRKRRTAVKSQTGGAEQAAAPVAETATTGPTVAVVKDAGATTAPPTPAALSPPSAPVSALGPPKPAPTPAPAAVKIAPKTGSATQAPLTPVPRILPKKRISGAPPAETLKAKPKFVVPAAPPVPKNNAGLDLKGAPNSSTPEQSGGAVGTAVAVRSRTRRAFKERRISLTVQPAKKSRKYRRTLRARVAEMPLQQVRRLLLRKGVLKPKTGTAAPPEEMMRSMLVDYMMLHHAD